MNLNEWTTTNYPSLLKAAQNISFNDELSEELLHYSLEILLTKENVQEIIDSGGAQFYMVRVMMNNWRSTTSPFYKIYRNMDNQIDIDSYLVKKDIEDDEYSDLDDEITNLLEVELQKLGWYDKTLFKLYCESDSTISSLARETKIPRTSISLTINRVRNHLKSKINQQK